MSTESDPIRVMARGAARAVEARILRPVWRPLPHQVPPDGQWYGWLLMAGRGAGKTDACAAYMADHVKGPPCLSGATPHWMSIIAPTQGDAATSCFHGPSGLQAHDPSAVLKTEPGGIVVRWPNGSVAKLFGAREPEDVERLRSGGNRCLAWLEELAAWRYLDDCWAHMRFGLRSGRRPHWVGSTTPKPRPLIKKLHAGTEARDVVISHATTYDNPYLPLHIREALEDRYGQTTLGAQELYGRIIEQDENALWRRDQLERYRVAAAPDDLRRVTVGVDPSGGAGEQGIVVGGKALHVVTRGDRRVTVPHGYVLADYSCHLSPEKWSDRAVQAGVDWEADDVCVEVNFGGDMAVATLRGAAERAGVAIPIRQVRASRGKRPRAEPVAAKASSGYVHHVGVHEELEDQQCTWTPEADYSPDRLDAMVWDFWHMKLVSVAPVGRGSFAGRDVARRVIA